MSAIEDFADWVHDTVGVPVILDLGEQGAPMPPVPYLQLRVTNRESGRVKAPVVSSENPDGTFAVSHRILWEETIRVTAYATTEGQARSTIDDVKTGAWFVEARDSLREKGLAFSWLSETISLGPGEEWAFADLVLYHAEDLADRVYIIEQADCPVTVTG